MQVDSKEAAAHPESVPYLKQFFEVETPVMQFGDYAWEGADFPGYCNPTYGLELTTISDALGKIRSNRLSYQMSGMLLEYDFTILMLIGKIYTNRDGSILIPGTPNKFSRKAFDSILFGAGLHGVLVQYVEDPKQALQRIALDIQYTQTPFADHKMFREIKPQPRSGSWMPLGEPMDDWVQGLMGVSPGAGEVLCSAALETYGSIHRLINTNETALRAIPGWGQKTAAAFHSFVRREFYGAGNQT